MEDVEYEGYYGFWAEDEESGEVGFLDESEDAFWVWDDNEEAFVGRFFTGRKTRRGAPKGKGKGRGRKGYSRMRPFKKRGYAHETEEQPTSEYPDPDAYWSKGKGRKGRGKGSKGKWSKGKAHLADESYEAYWGKSGKSSKGKSKGKGKKGDKKGKGKDEGP